jgi:hypothetical protein
MITEKVRRQLQMKIKTSMTRVSEFLKNGPQNWKNW